MTRFLGNLAVALLPLVGTTTDARFQRYEEETGLHDSWELDALEPTVLSGLIENAILDHRDDAQWEKDYQQQEDERSLLERTSQQWDDLVEHIE